MYIYVLPIINLIFLFILIGVFFSKKRIIDYKTKFFINLVIILYLSSILEIIIINFTQNELFNTYSYIYYFLNKIEVTLYSLWCLYSLEYLSATIHKKEDESTYYYMKKNKKVSKIFKIIETIIISYIFIMPYYINTNSIFKYLSISHLYLVIKLLYFLLWESTMIKHNKTLFKMINFPLYVNSILIVINAILGFLYPSLNIDNFNNTLIIFMMFTSMENPDVRLIEKLNITNEQILRASNAKTEFISNMSHEIRTPLNAIIGFSESLKEKINKDEVGEVINLSNILLQIINKILDEAKLSAGKFPLISNQYEFKLIFDELYEYAKSKVDKEKIIVLFKYDEAIPKYLYGDSIRLKMVLQNLIDNSIKFTEEGYIKFDVRCKTAKKNCEFRIIIEDTGIGIKEEDIPYIFEKFRSIGNTETDIDSIGLGLSLSKEILNLMNGTIEVTSDYQKGSEFIINFNQKIIANNDVIVSNKNYINFETLNLNDKNVLIIDDNNLNIKIIFNLLKKANIDAVCTLSGQEALEIVNQIRFDLILMDDMMPDMSGPETLINMKKIKEFDSPVIALTANVENGIREKYINLGFNDYLSKPINKDELNRIINEYLIKGGK